MIKQFFLELYLNLYHPKKKFGEHLNIDKSDYFMLLGFLLVLCYALHNLLFQTLENNLFTLMGLMSFVFISVYLIFITEVFTLGLKRDLLTQVMYVFLFAFFAPLSLFIPKKIIDYIMFKYFDYFLDLASSVVDSPLESTFFLICNEKGYIFDYQTDVMVDFEKGLKHYVNLNGLDKFLNKHFKHKGKYLKKKASLFYKKNHEYNYSFFLYLLLLPCKDKLRIDDLRDLMSCNRFYYVPESLSMKGVFDESLLADFNIYSSERIKIMFSQNYHQNTYLEILNLVYLFKKEDYPYEFPKEAHSLDDILSQLQFFHKSFRVGLVDFVCAKQKQAQSLDGYTYKGIDFKVVDSVMKIKRYGEKFRNCLKDIDMERHFHSSHDLLVIAEKKSKPCAAIHIKAGYIAEMKAFANKEVKKEDEIIIKHVLKKQGLLNE